MQRCIRRKPRDSTTRGSRRNFPNREIRCYSLTLELFGHGKLRSKWDGPFTVLNSASHGAVTLQDSDGNNFKINRQRLKIFLEPIMPNLEEFDVIEVINLD
jgi:hypothetical protein